MEVLLAGWPPFNIVSAALYEYTLCYMWGTWKTCAFSVKERKEISYARISMSENSVQSWKWWRKVAYNWQNAIWSKNMMLFIRRF